ncbi:MAG: type II secretion system secretin GspD [Chloroflexota bacterium]
MVTGRAFFILFVAAFFAVAGDPATVLDSVSEAAAKKEMKTDQKVTLNFVDVELPVITKFISEITGKNFIFDERLKGKITIIAPTKLSIDDAFTLFTSVLELKGFTVVPSGVDAYKIVPTTEAKQRGVSLALPGKTVNESYIARLIPLQNISSDDVLKFLQPMVSKDGYISTFGPGNLILIIDSGLNVDKVLSILEAIDKPAARGEPEMVLLRYASADAVAKIVNEGYGKGRARGPAGQPATTEEVKAVADTRLNALVLFGDKAARESMKSIISLLDVPSPETQGRINVYFLENSDAGEMAKILEGIVRGAQPQKQPQQGAPPVAPFEVAGGITITADKATNSLIIVASPADYQSLAQVIRQLDRRSRQVFVEVMVAEVSVNKLQDLGTKWRGAVTVNGQPIVVGGAGQVTTETLQNIIQGLSGLALGGFGNYITLPAGILGNSEITVPGFAALFQLSEFRDVINVLSTPQILTSDNREAEIIVAQNVPIITQKLSDITNVNNVISSIERKDVGIILRITPQITEGDYVRLNIYQEISALVQNQPQIEVLQQGPTITKRSTKTYVVVQDTQTVIIGGLIQDRDEKTVSKVPLLADIPVLGWLFKTENTTKEKINLVVFITPHIVRKADNLGRLSKEKDRDFARASELYAPDELLVKFREGVTDEQARAIIETHGAAIIRFIEDIRVYHLRIRKGQDVQEAVKEFSQLPQVEYAEPNYSLRMQNNK